jgi:hypothetical protein
MGGIIRVRLLEAEAHVEGGRMCGREHQQWASLPV